MKIQTISLILLVSISCSSYNIETKKTFHNMNIEVNSDNIPLDSNEYYFPLEMFPKLDFEYIEESPNSYIIERNIIEGKYDDFVVEWYSKHLFAMEEPLLFNKQTGKEIYRFTYLRTFDNPISIRIERNNKDIKLFWKQTDGKGGYEPGNLIIQNHRMISISDWKKINKLVQKTDFWNMKLGRVPEGEDGSEWIFEGSTIDNYKVITQWSRTGGPLYEVCMEMIKLTDLEIEKIY